MLLLLMLYVLESHLVRKRPYILVHYLYFKNKYCNFMFKTKKRNFDCAKLY